jgi:hypothetical protein
MGTPAVEPGVKIVNAAAVPSRRIRSGPTRHCASPLFHCSAVAAAS